MVSAKDYDSVLADLLDRACAAGMPPDTFWGLEPADTIAYVNAQEERSYNQNVELAQMIISALGNAMSKHPKKNQFPSYEEILGISTRKVNMTPEDRLQQRVAELRAKFSGKTNT